MATITSAADGNWSATATWSGGVVPGTGDTAVIQHTVTINTAITIRKIILDGGNIVMNYDVTFDDASGAGLQINADSGMSWTSNGTKASPRYMQSANNPPSNPWTIRVYDQTAEPDDRTLDFENIIMTGNDWYLGNDTNYIDFNGGGETDPLIETVSPLIRTPNLVEHFCDGRDYGRIYQVGTFAGTIQITGYLHWETLDFYTLADMISAKERISFFSRWVHLPLCRIENAQLTPRAGDPIIPFSIVLVEDR